MLLTSTSRSPPNSQVGRTIEYGEPDCARPDSTSALPRKYGSREVVDGFVMLTCTIRSTPARRAAANSVRECSTAPRYVLAPWSNRTQ